MDDEEKGEEQKGEDEDNIGTYVGARSADGERHGPGWAVLPNGDFYRGCYAHGHRNGKGLYVFMRNGARYDGEWRKGMKYGSGQFIYPDGSRYEGDWRYDLKQGFGVYSYPNGDVYEGAWFKGRRHGLGTYLHAGTQTKFMGTWVDDVIAGPGQVIYPKARFHGSWLSGKPKGGGCFVFHTNCMQHGFYLLVKEQKEEYGEGEEEKEEEKEIAGEEGEEYDETYGEAQFVRGGGYNNAGKTSVWRARNVTAYQPELLPPEAVPLPVHDSVESLSEGPAVCDALPFEPPSVVPEDEGDQDDSWLFHRQQFIEEAEKEPA